MNLEIPKELKFENQHNILDVSLLKDKLVVGCMGYSTSGKDVISRELVGSYGFKRIAFGDTLKEEMNKHMKEIVYSDLVSKHINLPFEKINFLEEKDKMIKETLRPYMIWCGEELRRINGKYYWMHKAFEKIKDAEKVVISDIRRIDELDIFKNNTFSNSRHLQSLICAGHMETENIVSFENSFEPILFHINQYKLEEKDELTVKAVQRAHEEWLFADTIYIDSRIEEEFREKYIKSITYLAHIKFNL